MGVYENCLGRDSPLIQDVRQLPNGKSYRSRSGTGLYRGIREDETILILCNGLSPLYSSVSLVILGYSEEASPYFQMWSNFESLTNALV